MQSTDWLARRAAGISHVSFEIDDSAPQNSEARFFMEMQLPYLLGHLHHHGRQINIALSTGQTLASLSIAIKDKTCHAAHKSLKSVQTLR